MRVFSWLCLIVSVVAPSAASSASQQMQEYEVCAGIVFRASKKIRLNSVEKRFACGNSEIEEWQEIPFAQKQMHLKSYLQRRGYHKSKVFKKNAEILVDVGPLTRLEKIVVDSPLGLDFFGRHSHLLLQALTPEHLNRIESWYKNELSLHGFPCTHVSSTAVVDTATVEVKIENARRKKLSRIDLDLASTSLDPRTLKRHIPVRIGQIFDHRLFELASRRMANDGFLLSSNFTFQCEQDGVLASQKVIYGEPRLVRLGVGADTEEYLVGLASWKTTRLDSLGSSFLVKVRASFKSQQAQLTFQSYWTQIYSLLPQLSFERVSESKYSILYSEGSLLHDFIWDAWGGRLNPRLGVKFSDERRLEGSGPADSQLILWTAQLNWMSHMYEYYIGNPQTGFHINWSFNYAEEGIYAPDDIFESSALLKWHFNIGAFSPPVLVSSWKLQGSVTASDASSVDLPFKFRQFLGGAQDLRGFARQELPRGDLGARTVFSLGTELRSSYVASRSLQFFPLFDLGMLGGRAFRVGSRVFCNPGLGARYDSPVGVFRATWAHGIVINERRDSGDLSHNQIYFNYGVEF